MPNLYRLDITLLHGLINGDQWEEIIGNYLTKLQFFRLKIKMEILNSYQSTEEYIDQLIRTFQNPFWIRKHQWFVRCFRQDNFIQLCSLSKPFHYSEDKLPHSLKSTYSNDNYQDLYNDINVICDETFFDQSIPGHIRLTNIKSLCIKLPINDQFWSIVSSLNRLNSLSVFSYSDTSHTQLQNLLDQAPNLHYLDIRQDGVLSLSTAIFQCRNKSVYQLDLRSYNYSFNEEECVQLCRSPLGVQCEVLSIVVTDRECIVYLIENIKNLRSLQIECVDNIEMDTNDELIEWSNIVYLQCVQLRVIHIGSMVLLYGFNRNKQKTDECE